MAGAIDLRRRRLLIASLLAGAAGSSRALGGSAAPLADAVPDRAGAALAPWRPGCLDIHHIATGRGNAAFVILPDGTSMLIDAGASNNGTDVSVAIRPNDSQRAGVWIARYAQRQLRAAGLPAALDYMLVTHIHPDHLGDPDANAPWSQQGKYRLSGVTDVAELMPVQTVIDRGFPDYSYPSLFEAPFADNYRAFIRARKERGWDVQKIAVGSAQQIASRRKPADGIPAWEIRNLAANGEVWSGASKDGNQTRQLFPPLKDLPRADWPNENNCSIAIRLAYGRFSYFTGGDLTSYTDDGALPWRNVLGPAAQAAGRVSVATADHHGMFDGLDGDVVRALQPRVWVIPSWHIVHPDMLQLERMFSQRLYPGPRDVFATTVMKENLLANERLTKRMRSHDGHIVIRVLPGGERFYVAVTDNASEADMVKLVTGPWAG